MMHYCAKYDSYLCLDSGEWTEPTCSEEGCKICASRPDSPKECTEAPCEGCDYHEIHGRR